MSDRISEPLTLEERADALSVHVGLSADPVSELSKLKSQKLVEDAGHAGDSFWLVLGGQQFGYRLQKDRQCGLG